MSKISELSDGGSLVSSDYLIAVRSGGNVKVRMDQINVDQIDLGDNEFIRLGNSQDLTIVHDASNSIINQAGIGDLLIQKAGSTKLTVNSSGIDVTGSVTATTDITISNGNNRFVASSTSAGDYVRMYGGSGTGKWDIYGNGANLRIGDNEGAGLVQIDTDLYTVGSVGIGAVPEAWGSGIVGVDIGTYGSLVDGTNVILSRNAYYDGAWKYKTTDHASSYWQDGGGQHIWQTAASGTADAALTWSETMRIDASGNVKIGYTGTGTPGNGNTDTGHLLKSDGRFFASSASNSQFNRNSDGDILTFRASGVSVGSIGVDSSDLVIDGSATDHAGLRFMDSQVNPRKNGALSNGAVDLGSGIYRWKDLHLSGLGYISGSDTQTNNIASASLGLRLSNTSNTDNNFAPIDFFNSSGFVTARIGAQFVDAGDRNTDLFFATRANSGSLTERMRIDSSGNLLIGVSTFANNTLGVAIRGAASGATDESIRCAVPATSSVLQIGFYNANGRVGSISTSGSATAFNTSSDYRLKENVVAMSGATERLKQLKPSRFNFIADANTTVDGFLAHEVQDVVPEAISGTKDAMRDEEYEVTPAVLDDDGNVVTEAVIGTRSVPDYQGIDQSKLVPLLVATIQELEARIAALES